MSAGRIAILSDDAIARRRLRSVLAIQNYQVCETPAVADLVLLDAVAPQREQCTELRADSDASLIVLAHSASDIEKAALLDAGADDILTYPVSTCELLARIRVALRRRPNLPTGSFSVDLEGVHIDLASRRVVADGRKFHLTPKEFELLGCLLENRNTTVPHSRLLRAIWGQQCRDQGACLRVMVNQLRRKIEPDPGNPKYLVTERWVGYRLELPESLEQRAR
jgi:two-component system KDP operon response regulator KdpE